MLDKINLTENQTDYAVYLPALNGVFWSPINKNISLHSKVGDVARCDFMSINGAFQYKWSLISAGGIQLVKDKNSSHEAFYRQRNRKDTFVLGDSGGFQLATGKWEGNWNSANCMKANNYRIRVLNWLDEYCDYGMSLDVPVWLLKQGQQVKDKTGIYKFYDCVSATHINNEMWLRRRSGDCKILNVLHGEKQMQSDIWYEEFKKYCDPEFTENHFDGWAFGGKLKTDIPNLLTRLVHIIRDNLLQKGKHDWIHILGTSKPTFAVVATALQRSLRKYVNSNVTISFDTSSPVLDCGRYRNIVSNIPHIHNERWKFSSKRMLEGSKYANDNRSYAEAMRYEQTPLQFIESPVIDGLTAKDLYMPNLEVKGLKAVKDTFLISHNIWCYVYGIQQANWKFDKGSRPKVLRDAIIEGLIDQIIFNAESDTSLALITLHKKTLNI